MEPKVNIPMPPTLGDWIKVAKRKEEKGRKQEKTKVGKRVEVIEHDNPFKELEREKEERTSNMKGPPQMTDSEDEGPGVVQ